MRQLSQLFAVMIVFVALWYALSRLLSPFNAVTIYEVGFPSTLQSINIDSTLEIATYNIAHGRGGKYGASNWQNKTETELLQHLDKIASQIQQANLDAIVLNEVDFSSVWSKHINQARYIAEKAGFRYVVEQRNMDISIPFFNFIFGNAILSKHPIKSSELVKFPHASSLENIFVGSHDGVMSVLQTPSRDIGLIAVHLEYRSEEIRVQSVKQINALAQAKPFPVFAVGDFNSTPSNFTRAQKTAANENALSYLQTQTGFVSDSKVVDNHSFYTFPSEKPNTTIDWIVGHGDIEAINTQIIQSTLSDHFMLTSSIGFKAFK